VKNSCKIGKKTGIPATSPKPRSYEKFLRKTQEKKILRNPVRNIFLDPKNKFLKTGIGNLDGSDVVVEILVLRLFSHQIVRDEPRRMVHGQQNWPGYLLGFSAFYGRGENLVTYKGRA